MREAEIEAIDNAADQQLNRRRALMLGAAAAGVALTPIGAAAAPARKAFVFPPGPENIPHWNTELKPVAPNVYAFIREGGPGIDNASMSNAGLIVGPDNAMLIDSLGPPIHAKELRRAVEKVTNKPVTRIVHTHHHRDHTNGDWIWPGAEIVTTQIMRKLLLAQGLPEHPYDNRPEWQGDMKDLKFVAPTTAISGPVSYWYGDTEVRLMIPGKAHTYGDIMVYLPQQKILFSGDIGFFYVAPAAFNANIAHWLTVIGEINAMDVTTIVPGHGPVGGKAELNDMAGYLRLLQVEIRRGYDAKKSPAMAAADARLGRYMNWGNPERIPAAAVRLYAEWSGKQTADNDVVAQTAAQKEYAAIMASRKRGA